MTVRCFTAPAKVNIALRVVGRRGDGYHLLETLMVFTDWADTLEFHPVATGKLTLECVPPVTGRPEDNLVLRAAHALAGLCPPGAAPGVHVRLHKRIPAGAGLGGGSSDAATTLLVLNRYWQLGLTMSQLIALGVTLGADIPVFLGGQAALARGVGEELTPCHELPEVDLVLIYPGQGLSTAAVFRALDGVFPPHATPLLPQARDVRQLAGLLENDLEAPARRLLPVLDDALQTLRAAGALGAGMSGSGSTLFGLFLPGDASRVAAQLAQAHPRWQVMACRSVNTHPFAAEWDAGTCEDGGTSR
ncbi:MAG: 4-(cytidine 5'-diphospho)-2-C-methyl-D-erythritol kinase [Magnetococcus sp. WYHC-3]